MAVISIKSFGGISPKTPTRLLQDSQAQIAINCPVFAGTINPLPGLSGSYATLSKTGTPQTIYRFGQDIISDDKYWFSWSTDIDVCRGQIAGDQSEWTFYTGDGAPKATYSTIALSGTEYPTVSRPLGLPMPTVPLSISLQPYNPTAYAATVTLTSAHIAALTVAHGIRYSLTTDTDSAYATVTLTSPITAASVAAALDAVSGINAAVDGEGGVTVKTDAKGPNAKLFLEGYAGQVYNKDQAFVYAGFDKSANGASSGKGWIVLDDAEIGALDVGHLIQLVISGPELSWDYYYRPTGPMTAATLAAALTALDPVHFANAGVSFAVVGSCVAIFPPTYARYSRWNAQNSVAKVLACSTNPNAVPASILMSEDDVFALRGKFISIVVNGAETIVEVPDTATVGSFAREIKSANVDGIVYGTEHPSVLVNTVATGTNVSLHLRGGAYPITVSYGKLNNQGYDDTPLSTETRSYTWTWVNKESGFEFESMPYTPSINDAPLASVDAYFDQSVYLSGRPAVPVGYQATHWRLYRSVSGTFLFVDEIPISQTSYTDTVLAENLGEPIPSTTWSPPPPELKGLINLPNGIMAGFVGRDVYYCDPYHPHAWPLQYVQTVDYPVVGLGRMDTTLAVLTTGTPYFLQGSHPDSVNVVKSDLEQSCASKRSIVSTNGVVIYASPDGLVMLSSGGSKLITEQLFTRAQWQTYFRPESIHAYAHDLKYIAFYDNGTTQGGFIFDATSGQLILHDIYATAGFSDLQRDQLYVSSSDRTIKTWLGGLPKSFTWKSKKFWMPKPVGYTCAQVEAENYPITLKVYTDNVLGYTLTVPDRNAFRLPDLIGRDWEFQVEGSYEVFSLAIAQSMQEIAGV